MKALGSQKDVEEDVEHFSDYYAIRKRLKSLLSANDNARYIITGHSVGGALAILFRAILALREEHDLLERMAGVYTFGQPRVVDEEFGQFMEIKVLKEHNVKYFRIVYCNDMVPRLPHDDKDRVFKHFGTCHYYDRDYKEHIFTEEPNKNYFSLGIQIPMMLNAFCELIRSFTLPIKYGPHCVEGNFMRLVRLTGLLMPGAAAHCLQNYVNLTRLGTPDVFIEPLKPKEQ